MQHVVEATVAANDLHFIDDLWHDWSPGYDASEDLALAKDCIRDPAHLRVALSYYWAYFDPTRFGSPEWAEEQAAAQGSGVQQPTLYLHGANDGAVGLTPEQV